MTQVSLDSAQNTSSDNSQLDSTLLETTLNTKTTMANDELNHDETSTSDKSTPGIDDSESKHGSIDDEDNKAETVKKEEEIEGKGEMTAPPLTLSIPTNAEEKDDDEAKAREIAKGFEGIDLSSNPTIEEQEEEWSLKSICWPPLPPPPSSSTSPLSAESQQSVEIHYSEGPVIKIITQNLNGPCSFICLCNILILRYDITITPSSRTSVSYSYLSSLVADYLLKIHTSSPISEVAPTLSNQTPNLDLASVLSILPTTRYGLNLNVRFAATDGFASDSSSHGTSAELSLFSLCRINLVHGWLVDAEEEENWETMVVKAGDYDNALMMLVEGEELSGGVSDEMLEFGEMAEDKLVEEIEKRSNWSETDRKKVKDAAVIRNFLDSTSTQLTYPGLVQLSTHLAPSSLSALFRNSHLSVIYRRPSLLSPTSNQPELFTLVTDSVLNHEPEVVWESLEDVDGSGSRFWNSTLKRSNINDWVRSDSSRRREPVEGERRVEERSEGNDLLLAQQLQQEEEDYDRRRTRAEQEREATSQAPPPPSRASGITASNIGGVGNVKKKKEKKDGCCIS